MAAALSTSERVVGYFVCVLLAFILISAQGAHGSLGPRTSLDDSKLKMAGILDKLQSLKNNIKSSAAAAATDNQVASTNDIESKGYGSGGGGGGGYGHGGGGHGAITLDPVSIISLLALGAFLINNILQLLRMNQASGRSLDVSDMNLPLELSDLEFQDGGPNTARAYNTPEEGDAPSFAQFFANIGSLYYLHPTKRNMCVKKVVCNYMNGKQTRSSSQRTLHSRVFDLMLMAITRFVAPEINERSGSGLCQKYNKYCSDSVLEDAKISTENKVYSTVTSLVSNYAIQSLLSTMTG